MELENYMRLVDKAVLDVIRQNEGQRLRQHEIAERVSVSPQTVWRTIRNLTNRGLIEPRGHNMNRHYVVTGKDAH